MPDNCITQRMKDLIVEYLGVNPDLVKPEANFIEDLGADSLDLLELVMAIKEEFQIEIPNEDADRLKTVGDAVKYVEEETK